MRLRRAGPASFDARPARLWRRNRLRELPGLYGSCPALAVKARCKTLLSPVTVPVAVL